MKKLIKNILRTLYFCRHGLIIIFSAAIITIFWIFILFQTNAEDTLIVIIPFIQDNLPRLIIIGYVLILYMDFKKELFNKIEQESKKLLEEIIAKLK